MAHRLPRCYSSFTARYPDSVDIALLTSVGQGLPSVLRGESEMLEHLLDNLLGRLYTEGRGFATCNENVAAFMRQIVHKHPRARILEIGAGTGPSGAFSAPPAHATNGTYILISRLASSNERQKHLPSMRPR